MSVLVPYAENTHKLHSFVPCDMFLLEFYIWFRFKVPYDTGLTGIIWKFLRYLHKFFSLLQLSSFGQVSWKYLVVKWNDLIFLAKDRGMKTKKKTFSVSMINCCQIFISTFQSGGCESESQPNHPLQRWFDSNFVSKAIHLQPADSSGKVASYLQRGRLVLARDQENWLGYGCPHCNIPTWW